MLVWLIAILCAAASACKLHGRTFRDGETWVERNIFVMRCVFTNTGGWKTEVARCKTPNGVDIPIGKSVTEGFTRYICFLAPNGKISYRRQQDPTVVCDGHEIGEFWIVNDNFNRSCTMRGSFIENCLTDLGVHVPINGRVTEAGTIFECVQDETQTVKLNRILVSDNHKFDVLKAGFAKRSKSTTSAATTTTTEPTTTTTAFTTTEIVSSTTEEVTPTPDEISSTQTESETSTFATTTEQSRPDVVETEADFNVNFSENGETTTPESTTFAMGIDEGEIDQAQIGSDGPQPPAPFENAQLPFDDPSSSQNFVAASNIVHEEPLGPEFAQLPAEPIHSVSPPSIRPPKGFHPPKSTEVTCVEDGVLREAGDTWVIFDKFLKTCTEEGAIIVMECIIDENTSMDVNSWLQIGTQTHHCWREGTQVFYELKDADDFA